MSLEVTRSVQVIQHDRFAAHDRVRCRALAAGQSPAQSPPDTGWPHYGNDQGGARYSSLAQINRDNVAQLRVVWTFRTGALLNETYLNRRAALVDGKLFLSTPYDHVIALDPQSGKKLWEYDPGIDLSHGYAVVTSRGVAAWRDTAARPDTPCALRIFIRRGRPGDRAPACGSARRSPSRG